MNNITRKQILVLLLMSATMALLLALMPEQAVKQSGTEASTVIVKQVSR